MGQTLDMTTAPTTTTTTGSMGGTGYEEAGEEEEKTNEPERANVAPEGTRARRSEEIRERLSSMSTSELIRTIFAAQEERVATYRTFEA